MENCIYYATNNPDNGYEFTASNPSPNLQDSIYQRFAHIYIADGSESPGLHPVWTTYPIEEQP